MYCGLLLYDFVTRFTILFFTNPVLELVEEETCFYNGGEELVAN